MRFKKCICLHVNLPVYRSDFNKTYIFSTDFRKILKYQISRKSVRCEPSFFMWTDERTDGRDEEQRDMTKLITAFRKRMTFCFVSIKNSYIG